jgi:hypothetical protein
MPSTDRKLELRAKTSVAQTGSQPFVYAKELMCSFVSLSILIVMYVPFCVSCLIVLFCVLFVCKCVLDYRHRDIRAPFRLT